MSRGSAGRLLLRSHDLRESVLERVVAALAARADLPIDRVADAQLVAAAIVAATADSGVEPLSVGLDARDDAVGLEVGPLAPGEAARVVADSAVPGVGPVLERLVDGWSVDRCGDGNEVLRLTIGAGAPATQ
ncbi:hypothetical protein [Miltoncostaea marina]|uniref:hypothetical protein n=1 Tax=Miltoncostaea marina TaxID=2843215 RepID=UPI001C3D5C51|nr:hypothetical protein [Miltoncostaea marina]